MDILGYFYKIKLETDENGNPIKREDGKMVKGSNYFPPDIAHKLRDYL